MDERKLKFLIGIQREIDLMGAKPSKSQNMERMKAKFYDLAKLEDVVASTIKIENDETQRGSGETLTEDRKTELEADKKKLEDAIKVFEESIDNTEIQAAVSVVAEDVMKKDNIDGEKYLLEQEQIIINDPQKLNAFRKLSIKFQSEDRDQQANSTILTLVFGEWSTNKLKEINEELSKEPATAQINVEKDALEEDDHLGAIDQLTEGVGQFVAQKEVKKGDELKFFLGGKSKNLYNNYNYKVGDTVFVKQEISKENQREYFKTYKEKENEYIDPYNLYDFLFKYNQEKVLKTTCHEADSDQVELINDICGTRSYNFEKHLEKVVSSYEKLESNSYVNYKVKALFRAYLTGKDYKGDQIKAGWSEDNIKVHWQHPDLLGWVQDNPKWAPHYNEVALGDHEIVGYEFDQINSKVTGKTIQNFTQLVLHFKHLFHIRSDNSLKEIIENINTLEGFNEDINFDINTDSFRKNIEHFTDVDKLRQAYVKLIKLILKNGDKKPLVKLKFHQLDSSVCLSIHHVNSVYKKTQKNALERLGDQYDYLINNQVNGLCNLYLNADFGYGEFATINLWNGVKPKVTIIPKFVGVEHVLEFPTKKRENDIFN